MTGAGALAAAAVGLRAAGRRRAVFLAVAAGLADSCTAVVTMAFSYVASHGLAALSTSWTVYAVVACGAANVLLTQTAYQTRPAWPAELPPASPCSSPASRSPASPAPPPTPSLRARSRRTESVAA
jgi:hypothetical protein